MNHHGIVRRRIRSLEATPLPSRMLQRKCACGQHTPGGGECRKGEEFAHPIQAKLQVGKANDRYEQEADRVADRVMRMPEPARADADTHLQAEAIVQTRVASSQAGSAEVPSLVHDVLRAPGQPLDSAVRHFMEPRFGHNFADVKVHANQKAAESARSIGARAYAVGQNIVVSPENFSPHSRSGQRLLAHELTHVVQQSEGRSSFHFPTLQRQSFGEPQLEFPDPRDPTISSAPKGKAWTGASAKCGPDFCRPWATQRTAEDDRNLLWPVLMLGIAAKVNTKVVSLWNQWATGGSSLKNLDKGFSKDFRDSKTTAKTTTFLVAELKARLAASPPVIPVGVPTTLQISSLIPAAIKAIDTPGHKNEMNFNVIGEIPGNIAGGLGKNQAAEPIGAMPSTQDDARIVTGDVAVTKDGAGQMTVVPTLNYTVKDTIDLCPGNCGADKEKIATVPMSRWEATGISGDVPFTVGMPAITSPFVIP